MPSAASRQQNQSRKGTGIESKWLDEEDAAVQPLKPLTFGDQKGPSGDAPEGP
jgi:hypothetical protein